MPAQPRLRHRCLCTCAACRSGEREKQVMANFARSEGANNATEDADLIDDNAVQTAVTSLYKAGGALEEGDLAGAKAVLVGDWAAADTIQRLSVSDRQKKAAGSFVNAVPTLTGASSLTEAKAAFVSTAGALESWCKLTGYDSVVAGL